MTSDQDCETIISLVEDCFPNCLDEVTAILYTFNDLVRVQCDRSENDHHTLTLFVSIGEVANITSNGNNNCYCSAHFELSISKEYPTVPAKLKIRRMRGFKSKTEQLFEKSLQVCAIF